MFNHTPAITLPDMDTLYLCLRTPAAADRVLTDLEQRPGKWLRRAAEVMAKATLGDWKGWAKA